MRKEADEGVLGWLDGPHLVVGAFAFFLCGLTILGILLWNDQREAVKRIDVLTDQHIAQQKAANAQAVDRCFASANVTPALDRVLKVLEADVATLEGRLALRDFRKMNDLNATTLRECRQLADKLNVPIPKGVR